MSPGTSSGTPWPHLAVAAGALLALIIGGSITFGTWGSFPVRPVALWVLAAVVLHGAARYVTRGTLALRGAAWLTLGLMTIQVSVLARPEVLVPLAAVALVDLALAHTREDAELDLPPGTVGKATAGTASLLALVLAAALVFLARDTLILVRLGSVVLVAWALVTTFSLRPATRTPMLLLGGAGAFSVTFLLLAAPVLPFGPLLAYWAMILSVAVAVLTGAFSRSSAPVGPDKVRHAQRVHPLPDPALSALAERIRRYLKTGDGGRDLSRRIEEARGRDEDGRLLPALAEAQARGTRPSRADRRRALAELLDTDIPEREGPA